MQREACWTRRGAGGSEFVQGNGYLAAGYLHRSSRNGDPQLHTHVLVANATKGPGRPLDPPLPPGKSTTTPRLPDTSTRSTFATC
jgi:TrwC relaxase